MGCYPLKEMISRALGKHNGKEKRRASHMHTMMYSQQPPVYSHQKTTVVKSVNFSNHNPIIIIPPEPDPGPPISNHYAEPAIDPPPSGPTPSKEHEVTKSKGSKNRSKKGSKKTQFVPDKDNNQPGPIHHEPSPNYHGPIQHETDPGYHSPIHHEPGPSSYPDPVHREPNPAYRGPVPYYTPSPLPRWEYGARRQEYFSGEYCYYPTPIREGIYSIATDPHRLTTIFSEENPNACSIV